MGFYMDKVALVPLFVRELRHHYNSFIIPSVTHPINFITTEFCKTLVTARPLVMTQYVLTI